MSISFRRLRIGERLLLEPIEGPPLERPVKASVSSVCKSAIVVTLQDRRDQPVITAGQKLRVAAASGAWSVRATVAAAPLHGAASFTICVESIEPSSEQRAERRLSIQTPIRIKTVAVPPLEFIARSEDLSVGGVRLETMHMLAAGTRLWTVLSLDTGRTLNLKGTVVWCGESPRQRGRFVVGVRFVDLPPLPKLALERFLHKKERELDRG